MPTEARLRAVLQPLLLLFASAPALAEPPAHEPVPCVSISSRTAREAVRSLATKLQPHLPSALTLVDGETWCVEARRTPWGTYEQLTPVASSTGAPLSLRLTVKGESRTLEITNRTGHILNVSGGPTPGGGFSRWLSPHETDVVELSGTTAAIFVYEATWKAVPVDVPRRPEPPPPSWFDIGENDAPLSTSFAADLRVDAVDLRALEAALVPSGQHSARLFLPSVGGALSLAIYRGRLTLGGGGFVESLGGPDQSATLSNFRVNADFAYSLIRTRHLTLSPFAGLGVRGLIAWLGNDPAQVPAPAWAQGHRELNYSAGMLELGVDWSYDALGMTEEVGWIAAGLHSRLGVALPLGSRWFYTREDAPGVDLAGPPLDLTSLFFQVGVHFSGGKRDTP